MQKCDRCGSRKVRFTKWNGQSRVGPKFITGQDGKKKLAPCNGEATRLCRSCLQD